MFTSLASLINFASGCSLFVSQFVVNDGALLFSVKSYLIPTASNALATDLAAHMSTATPDNFFISVIKLLSNVLNCFFNISALSKSILIPISLIFINIGSNSISVFHIVCNCSFLTNVFK